MIIYDISLFYDVQKHMDITTFQNKISWQPFWTIETKSVQIRKKTVTPNNWYNCTSDAPEWILLVQETTSYSRYGWGKKTEPAKLTAASLILSKAQDGLEIRNLKIDESQQIYQVEMGMEVLPRPSKFMEQGDQN